MATRSAFIIEKTGHLHRFPLNHRIMHIRTRFAPLLFLVFLSNLVVHCELAASRWADEGKAFLESNKNRRGVVTTDSGLQYRILIPGNGPKPGRYANVAVFYRGTLFDGTEFDSASITKPPVVLNVSRVIRGWQEALPMMPVGSMWELYIPAELAYGRRGSGKNIPPDSVLIFELELVEIR